MPGSLKQKINSPIFIAALCTLFILLVNGILPSHSNGFPHSLNFDPILLWQNDHAKLHFEARINDTEFGRRYLVNGFQQITKKVFGWPHQFSFNLINYLSLFFFLIQFHKLSELVTREKVDAIYFIPGAAFSFSILFAFLATISTIDDIVQYCLLTVTIILFIKRQRWISAFFFFIACMARETSLLFIPFFIWYEGKNGNIGLRSLMPWVLIPVCYLVLQFYLMDEDLRQATVSFLLRKRFYAWEWNFLNLNRTSETFFCFLLVLALPIWLTYLAYPQLIHRPGKLLLQFGVALIVINSLLVLISATAREARLFFLPLLLIYPVWGNAFRIFVQAWWADLLNARGAFWLTTFALSTAIALGLYRPSTLGTGYVFKAYLLVYLMILISSIRFWFSGQSKQMREFPSKIGNNA